MAELYLAALLWLLVKTCERGQHVFTCYAVKTNKGFVFNLKKIYF